MLAQTESQSCHKNRSRIQTRRTATSPNHSVALKHCAVDCRLLPALHEFVVIFHGLVHCDSPNDPHLNSLLHSTIAPASYLNLQRPAGSRHMILCTYAAQASGTEVFHLLLVLACQQHVQESCISAQVCRTSVASLLCLTMGSGFAGSSTADAAQATSFSVQVPYDRLTVRECMQTALASALQSNTRVLHSITGHAACKSLLLPALMQSCCQSMHVSSRCAGRHTRSPIVFILRLFVRFVNLRAPPPGPMAEVLPAKPAPNAT